MLATDTEYITSDSESPSSQSSTASDEKSQATQPSSQESTSSNGNSNKRTKQQPDEKIKEKVAKLMAQCSSRLEFADKLFKTDAKHSDIWSKYKEAMIDGERVGIFKCNCCTALFIYKSSTGTSAMNRHNCDSRNSKQTTSRKCENSLDSFVRKIVPLQSIRELNRNITIGFAVDLQPLSRVERRGFLHIAQSLINFGSKFGAQSATEIIQHRTTLQRNRLPEVCAELCKNLKETLANIPIYPKFAFTSDMWTEKYHSQGCLALSAHFIDSDWVLQKKLLGMEPFDEQKTTVNIREDCTKILKQYFDESQIENIMAQSTAVTDGEASIKGVFPNHEPCHCHNINLVCEWTFSVKPVLDPEKIKKRADAGNPYHPKRLFNLKRDCPQIDATIEGVKEVVTYFKRSHLNSKLSITLKQEVPTRFNSLLFVLESYKNVSEEVKTILIKTERLNMIQNVSDSLVASLVAFLEPFDASSTVLSGDKYPTINLVALHYHDLERHIEIRKSDCNEIQTLKRQAAFCFKEYCKTTTFHFMACMLDPRYRSLKFASSRTRKSAIRFLQRLVSEIEEQSLEDLSQSVPQTPKTKGKFDDYQDDPDVIEHSEVDRYLTFVLPERKPDDKFDLLEFWRDHGKHFPVVQKIAMRVLAVPASEITAERVFSGAGYAMNPRRTLLDIETLSDTIFVQQNLSDLKKD